MKDKIERMRELIHTLDQAGRAYYQESREIMSNFEYDALYDELSALEKETGTVLAGSPTQKAGYEVLSELPKEEHQSPMLSLDKTKDVQRLAEFLGQQKGVLSWKLDGLTIVLTYEKGNLVKAVTRGNGEVGEVVTPNARTFKNLPLKIPFQGNLVVRGEAVIRYSDFEKMNEEIEDVDARYKNPRNLCAGSVRQLNSEITASRHVNLMVFALILAQKDGNALEFDNSRMRQFAWLKEQGFDVVEHFLVDAGNVAERVKWFSEAISKNDNPSDGLVLLLEDIAYGESLGRTAKFPRNAIAFKWKDETAQTTLESIQWSPSRTGLINPVAVFDPVELEGTTVSRASVHNISIMESLELGIGDAITVYKANMIIPQIAENLTRSGNMSIPETCPVCGGKTQIRQTADVKSLYCTNPECQAKQIKAFDLFVSRNALNMDGLSEATMEKFIGRGFIREFADIFHLDNHREEIVEMEGFGEKSYENMMDSIEAARNTTLSRLLYGLGIPGIGTANAKVLSRAFQWDVNRIRSASLEELTEIDGIGPVLAQGIAEYFSNPQKAAMVDRLLKELTIQPEETAEEQTLAGKTFVITGSVRHFANRNELKSFIEQRGGKVTGTVSSKTDYLINNDTASTSSKNRKARELGIPILSEEELLGGAYADTSGK